MTKSKSILNKVARVCSLELCITLPPIVFGLDKKRKWNLARLVLDRNKKPIRLEIDLSHDILMDLILAVVHELRHVYQCEI